MKPLACEMCGSTNVIKQDGVFVCQSCGTKYSVEEARKMMIEGTVAIEGTVKVDKSGEALNLLKLANAALDSENGEEAYSYANRALEADPNNAEAWLTKMKAVNLLITFQDPKVLEVIKTGQNAIELSDGKLAKEVYTFFLNKIIDTLNLYIEQLQDTEDIKAVYKANTESHFLSAPKLTAQSDIICNIILNQADTIVKLRDSVPDSVVASDSDIIQLVVEVANQWVNYAQAINHRLNVYTLSMSDEDVTKYRSTLNRIKQGLPEHLNDFIKEDAINNSIKGGCYVATAVYGSYNCPEVRTLRRFRDLYLKQHILGRAFIKIYYAISPALVRKFGDTAWFKAMCKTPLDKWVTRLQEKGYDSTPYDD